MGYRFILKTNTYTPTYDYFDVNTKKQGYEHLKELGYTKKYIAEIIKGNY